MVEEPDNLELLIGLGNGYFDIGQYYAAIEAYNKALAIKPDIPDVLVDLGIMYRRVEKYDDALEQFKKALEYDPKHVNSYLNMAVVYKFDLKDYQKALDTYYKFVEYAPPLNPMIEKVKSAEIPELKKLLNK